MAKRTSTHTTRITLAKFSWWMVVIIGVVMCVLGICKMIGVSGLDSAGKYIINVCCALALIVPLILSYRVARGKSTGWFVFWIICVILIVVGIILTAIK